MANPGDRLRALHDDVDREAQAIERRHAARIRCRQGCHDCCVDGLTVFEIEAERIRRRHGPLLRNSAPHPSGACAFLDGQGACRVYGDRPYVCRTQGLPLRWIGEDDQGREAEFRDICPLNEEGGPPPEELEAGECWTIGPYEERLASLQADRRRVALRSLFDRG